MFLRPTTARRRAQALLRYAASRALVGGRHATNGAGRSERQPADPAAPQQKERPSRASHECEQHQHDRREDHHVNQLFAPLRAFVLAANPRNSPAYRPGMAFQCRRWIGRCC